MQILDHEHGVMSYVLHRDYCDCLLFVHHNSGQSFIVFD